MARTPVYLNIYDMYWLNEYASNIGVGVFHSGIEVYGLEYAYGGHPLPCSGIFENTPKDANELGENFKFRESILIGETDFSASEVRRMVQLMGEEYRGDRYHLISKNCNHFTSALAKTLTGNDIPSWVNRLASISNSIPFLERWIPQEWLTPIALQHSLDEKSKMALANAAEKRNMQNGTAAPPSSSTQQQQSGWKWFQRRASSTISSTVSTATDITTRSVPNTARSMATASASALNTAIGTSSSENVTTATATSSPSLTRLWNSIKSVTAAPSTDLTTCSSSSASSSKGSRRDAGNRNSNMAATKSSSRDNNDKELNNRDNAAARS